MNGSEMGMQDDELNELLESAEDQVQHKKMSLMPFTKTSARK